ncbi:hypothetical protein [Nostoc sp.]|uniref:hypothetical protein n=1 Tax=Nostoc sp. TaxID=1180 RepID=UPI002FF7FD7B
MKQTAFDSTTKVDDSRTLKKSFGIMPDLVLEGDPQDHPVNAVVGTELVEIPNLKTAKKSFDAAPEVAFDLVEIAREMGVPQSAVIVFALKDFFLKYYKEKHERTQLRAA